MPGMNPFMESGAELYASTATATSDPDGKATGTVTRDTTVKNTRGRASFKCDSAAGNAAAFNTKTLVNNSGVTTYVVKASFRMTDLPSSTVRILNLLTSGGSLKLDSSGAIHAFSDAGVDKGSGGSLTADGLFHCLEWNYTIGANPNNRSIVRLDGIPIIDTGAYTGVVGSGPTALDYGWVDAPGASKILNIDDVVVYQPGSSPFSGYDARIVLLLPVSDGSLVGWTDGGGGTTNLFAALDNTPPAGVNVAANGTQIKDVNKNTTDAFTANLQTYLQAGIIPSDFVQYAIGYAYVANSGTTAITENFSSATGPFGAFGVAGPAAAAGTWPTNWTLGKSGIGSINGGSGNPGLADINAARSMTITKGTSSNNGGYCCFMGGVLVFTPQPTLDQRTPLVVGQAVKRAAFYMSALPLPSWRRRRSGLLVPELA